MDGFADAGAGGLDTGEAYGFHLRRFSLMLTEEGWKSIIKMKNHQPRLREGGLGGAVVTEDLLVRLDFPRADWSL